MMKPCNGCTLCCDLLEVKPLEKAANQACAHCEVGVGCKIYDRRPPVCGTFDCLWRASPVMDEEMRPDRLGMMFEAYRPERLVVVIVTDGDWTNGKAKKLLTRIAQDGYVVWIMVGKDRHLLLPPGVPEAEGHERAQTAWRRKHGRA